MRKLRIYLSDFFEWLSVQFELLSGRIYPPMTPEEEEEWRDSFLKEMDQLRNRL